MPNEATLSLDSPELSQSDYRALREGREVPVTPKADTSSSAAAADADTLTPAAETAADSETAEHSEDETKQEAPKPKSDKLQARFSELTAKIKTLETQLAAKSGGTTTPNESTAKPAADTPLAAPADDPEPKIEDHTDYIDWQKKWMRWELRQTTRSAEAARAAAEQKAAAATKADAWQARVNEAKSAKPDFADVAQNPDLSVTKVMGDAIVESEIGPEILYHLGKNPAEAARIAKLSPVSQIREIGKLERTLEAANAAADGDPAADAPQTKKPSVSKAPAPHKPIAGVPTAPAHKNLEGMTQAEYRAYRESGKIR